MVQINEDINENAADFDISYYLSYTFSMKHYEWNDAKNTLLKTERDVSFEDVITAISEGFVFDDVKHPNVKKYRGNFGQQREPQLSKCESQSSRQANKCFGI